MVKYRHNRLFLHCFLFLVAMISARIIFPLRLLSLPRSLQRRLKLATRSLSCVEYGKAPVNGVDLHYEVRGNGKHPIVCIPGALGTAKTDFEPQLAYFGREGSGFKIVAFDPRGYGSSRPAQRFGGNFFVQDAMDAVGLMWYLSIPNFSCFGWSDGSISSLFLAARYSSAVRKLVTWGGNAYVTPEELEFYETIRDVSKWSPKMHESLYKIYGESLQSLWSEWTDAILEVAGKSGGDICKEELSNIKCPTLILHGAKDPMVPSFHSQYLNKHIAGSHLVVMDEGKHNFHLRYAEEFNRTVEEFLKAPQGSVVDS